MFNGLAAVGRNGWMPWDLVMRQRNRLKDTVQLTTTLSENDEQNGTARGAMAGHWGGTRGTAFVPLIMLGIKYVPFCTSGNLRANN